MGKNKYIVRIESISVQNFKNISNGTVFYNEFKKIERKDISNLEFSNVLGIYGQNASGKTSIIEALAVVRSFLIGGGVAPGIRNFIKKGTDGFSISTSFLLMNDEKTILANYSISLKENDTNIFVDNETLQCYESNDENNKLGDKKTLFSFNFKNGLKESFLSLIDDKNQRTILNYIAIQKTNYVKNIGIPGNIFSSLFNDETVNIISKENGLASTFEIIDSIKYFSRNKFLIVTPKMFDDINRNAVGLNGFDFNENQEGVHKAFSIFFGRQILEENDYKQFLKILNASSKVLGTLIPGLCIKPHVYNESFNAFGRKTIEFETMSIRDGNEISLFYESRGVKQLLSYVGDLIGVFNEEGTFIAIDELDSGVFEYLLGEMIYSFDNFALGQLLFTSHNFRILEKIKSNEIFFTIPNEENKFVQPKYIKNNNNLRDVYYRLIVQGDDKETYYNKTSSSEISKIFSLLGKAKQ